MYLWTNHDTGEEIQNELPYITVGGNGTGSVTYAFIGDSNVIIFAIEGNQSVETMNNYFADSAWEIKEM